MDRSKTPSDKTKRQPAVSTRSSSNQSPNLVPVLLTVPLWAATGGDVPSLVLTMAGDLLSVSPCELRDGATSPLSAFFPSTAQAVLATRRLRRLVAGFSRGSKAGPLGASFILSDGELTTPEIELQVLRRLPDLTRLHSGQIFVLGALYESARTIPGLRFEVVSGEESGLNAPYRSLFQLLPPVHMQGYVEEPLDLWAPALESKPKIPPRVDSPAIQAETEAPAIGETDSTATQVVATPFPTSTPDQGIAAFSRIEGARKRLPPLAWAGGAGVAVIVVAAVSAVIVHSQRTAPPSGPVQRPPVAPVHESVKPTIEAPRESAESERKAVAVRRDKPAKAPEKPPAEPKKPELPKASGLFTADEIPMLLNRADRDSGDGKFDQAIKEYQIVLNHEPSNARAKEGKARAIRNRGLE